MTNVFFQKHYTTGLPVKLIFHLINCRNHTFARGSIVIPILGNGLHAAMLFLIVPFILVTMFTLGVALILASMTVFFLDAGEFYNVILMPWMFLTPIMYPMDIVPEKYQILIKMNPMYYFIECFRYPIYNGTLPSLGMIVMSAIMAVVTLIIGYRVFTRAEDDFVYYV